MTLLVRSGKGKKDRYVPIGQRALAWIDKYLAKARPLPARRAETPLVFVSRNGHPLHANQLSKIVRDYLRGAGIDKPGACHLFRHATATFMLEAGADVRYIQALLGHTKLVHHAIYPTSRSPSCGKCTSARIRPACSACPTRRHLRRPTTATRRRRRPRVGPVA